MTPILILSGPPAGSRFRITDIPLVTGREYDQWEFVNRQSAEYLAATFPQTYKIQGEFMSVATTLEQITSETMQHAPIVLGTAIAVENAVGNKLPGETKAQIVVNSVLAGAQVAGQSTNVTVSSIAALTALLVGILNATGMFKHAPKAQ